MFIHVTLKFINKLRVSFLGLSILIACKIDTKVNYPKTKTGETTDTYFNIEVKDPYRWLEDDRSEDTKAWVVSQNETTSQFLDKIPFRNQLKERLSYLWNYEKVGAPFKQGKYTYFSKNDGLQNQNVYYRKKDGGEDQLFLDPNTFSKDGTTALGALSFSENGDMLAYSISEGGSDWRKVFVIHTETKETI